jgi:alkylation response protein AidB-like acyl-CoA dehydrogenase
VARSLIWLAADRVQAATLTEGAVAPVESLFAYPMGTVEPEGLEWSTLAADPREAADLWRVATAAELAGLLKGALDSVLEHVRIRQQFGRALGSFQAVQHRLATASLQIEATRLRTLRAAQSGAPEDAAAALGYGQLMATRIGYDLHQFMGAMGLTLEHPLHRWTYRIRLLRSAFGGASGAMQALASHRWEAA